MAAAKTRTAATLAAELAPHMTGTLSLKADGIVLHPNDPAPTNLAHIEVVDVTDYPYPN